MQTQTRAIIFKLVSNNISINKTSNFGTVCENKIIFKKKDSNLDSFKTSKPCNLG